VLQPPAEPSEAEKLRAELAEEKKQRKDREQQICELQDENFQLKQVRKPAAPKKERVRLTFFDPED
jgi:hypothetical protein